jgi:ABC-2 type transport system ATP-binding protein
VNRAEAEISVEAEDLTKTFGDFRAVDRVSFEVFKGEIFGFLGPNGAGKTTTMKILCGLLTPTSGTARVAGYDVSTEFDQIRKNIGYMSQKFSIYEDLTVAENLAFFGGVYGLHGDEKSRRTEWVLQMAGLTEQQKTLTAELPLGWKQRLALGCAVLHTPPILFLDEPTSGVDPLSRRNFWDLIHGMAEQGVTVFVTTHYMDEAGYCNRLALMSAGRLIAMGTPGELKSDRMSESVVELSCDAPLEAAELLRGQPGITEAALFGTTLHIVTPDPEKAVELAKELLSKHDIKVERTETIAPSLEDVFVTLTMQNDNNG